MKKITAQYKKKGLVGDDNSSGRKRKRIPFSVPAHCKTVKRTGLKRLHIVFEPGSKLSPNFWVFEGKLNNRLHVLQFIPSIIELPTFNLGCEHLLPISNHEFDRIIIVQLTSLFESIVCLF